MTQKQFAAMAGVSLPSIKAVESGQYPVKPRLAHKIALATGAQLLWWDFRHTHQGKVKRRPVPDGEIYWLPMGDSMCDEIIESGKRPERLYTRKHFNLHRRFFQTDSSAAKLEGLIRSAHPIPQRSAKGGQTVL